MAEFDLNEAKIWQFSWDRFFMLDLDPENAARFGLNLLKIARRIAAHHGREI
ncbi:MULTISPECIES: hypothetical protein [unclassified Pseudoxanthomonas]|uniref:hypothetical protein n=1 Tax=unclassified Pseudoxanthomonas TaxID=2645906 RepID=UPI003077B49C